ncbi:MAG: BlaI/MecI/CopY family transcriptional regulator [Acidobacteriota bacterium]|nr:BlaI/MecI/CopY family transcriptional regulator [Acidobacteriota bacterium]
MGHLEMTVMEILWEQGGGSVHSVLASLSRPLAYNTVMTTLHRLYKKGLLRRDKQARAFYYSPRLSRVEWEQKRAEELIGSFMAEPRRAAELLVSCLVDAVGEHDATLLDDLEESIRRKRRELRPEGVA